MKMKLRLFKFSYVLNTKGKILAHNRFHAVVRLKRKHDINIGINDLKEEKWKN